MPTGPNPTVLANFQATVANSTPSGATDGYATGGNRFLNIWYNMSAGSTSVTTRIWFYRQSVGWVLYTDVPTTTILTANGGGFLQLEARGVQRVYVELITFTGNPTVDVHIDGITY